VVGVNERARVPFALVGVLLLVGSATLSGGLGGVDPTDEPATEAAIEDARRGLGGDLRDATRAAARRAAADPVVEPADTTLGRALAATGDPFRAALALRVYLDLRDRHDTTRVRGVTTETTLPALSTAADLRRALARTTVRRAGENGTALRVTVSNVTITARADGRVVERRTVSPTVSVASSVLLLHDRTARFDRRLDADATQPGLARRTTARLYALAWGRGLAQYGGAPIANVVGNHHVAVATNGGLLAEQRAVFGAVDDAGLRATRAATARAAAVDALAGAGASGQETTAIIERTDDAVAGSTLDPVVAATAPPTGPADERRIAVGDAALTAFRSTVDTLDETLASAYEVRVRRRVDTAHVSTRRSGRHAPSGEGWSLDGTDSDTVRVAADATASRPAVDEPWHVLSVAGRTVTERRTTTRRWRRGNRTARTTETVTRRFHVRIAVLCRHDGGDAPPRPVRPVHERGGALDGPNLRGVAAAASARLGTDHDRTARRAVAGNSGSESATLRRPRPADLRGWVYRDLRSLRREVRNVSVTVERGALGTYRANPAARLAAALRERRAELVDAPARYDGVADRARVAARVAYLDAVLAELRARAAPARRAGARFESLLAEHGLSGARLAALADVAGETRVRDAAAVEGAAADYDLVVEGAPAYLALTAVDRAATDARGTGTDTALAARNLNLFTVPYADVADGVVAGLFAGDRVRLRSAARALRAANRLPANASDGQLATRRDRLRTAVRAALDRRRGALRERLARAGVGESEAARRRVVASALEPWETPAVRALAFANGTVAGAVTSVATDRYPNAVAGVEARDGLRLSLRAAATTGPGVREPAVNRSVAATKRAARGVASRAADRATEAATDRLEERLGRSVARVPAGLPVTPLPSQWYVTTNVWVVEARGAYDRFAVRSRESVPGAAPTYVRDGGTVGLDWDGDGTDERAGRAAEVDLSVETAVVVVVPPGGQGVGDTDGNADERSPGW
jgi:hypothetical protein